MNLLNLGCACADRMTYCHAYITHPKNMILLLSLLSRQLINFTMISHKIVKLKLLSEIKIVLNIKKSHATTVQLQTKLIFDN